MHSNICCGMMGETLILAQPHFYIIMKKLLFINPYEKNLSGVALKVKYQQEALNTQYVVDEYCIVPEALGLKRYITWLLRELYLVGLLFHPRIHIYYRYCPFMVITNILIAALSLHRQTWVEYNGNYKDEIALKSKWLIPFHVFSMFFLRRSQIIHLPTAEHIAKAEKLVGNIHVLHNGYGTRQTLERTTSAAPPKKAREISDILLARQNAGKKVLCLIASAPAPWHGIDRIVELFERWEDCFVVLIGNHPCFEKLTRMVEKGQAQNFGPVSTSCLYTIYQHIDFGLGSFAIDRCGLQGNAALKVREYLIHGVPVIINCEDPLTEIDDIKPYAHKIDWNEFAHTRAFLDTEFSRKKISTAACKQLSWDKAFERAGILAEK